MNLEIAIKEKDNVVKLKITSPDKPLVIELRLARHRSCDER